MAEPCLCRWVLTCLSSYIVWPCALWYVPCNPGFVRARAGWKMENRCNGAAGKFKPAELLPTKLILSAMLKKSYLGRDPFVTLTKTATPIRRRKLIGDLSLPTEKFPSRSEASRPRLARSLSVFSTGNSRRVLFARALKGRYVRRTTKSSVEAKADLHRLSVYELRMDSGLGPKGQCADFQFRADEKNSDGVSARVAEAIQSAGRI